MEGTQETKKMEAAHRVVEVAQNKGPTQAMAEILDQTQKTLVHEGKNAHADKHTKETIQDVGKLAGALKDVVLEKDVGDRLQKIAQESQLAQAEIRENAPRPQHAGETRQGATNIMETFRPLFTMMTSSRELRSMIINMLKIGRKVLLRTTDTGDRKDRVETQFLEGHNTADIARRELQQTANVLRTEGLNRDNITDDEWNTIQDDMYRVFVEITRHPNYRTGLESLFGLVDQVAGKGSIAGYEAKKMANMPHAQKAREETTKLVASFTGREALERFRHSFMELRVRIEKDEHARQWLWDIRQHIMQSHTEAELNSEEFKYRTRELASRGRRIVREMRYTDEVRDFIDCSYALVHNMRDDAVMRELQKRAGIVAQDLMYADENGEARVDMEALNKLRSAMIPLLAEGLKYIPIPKIESDTPKQTVVVDNIVLCAYDFISDNISMRFETDNDLSIRHLNTRMNSRLVISIRKIRTEVKDLKFYFKRKTFPKMSEGGYVTVRLGGDGATLTITFDVEQGRDDRTPVLRSGRADFDISRLDIDFDKSSLKHDVLVPMVTKMFKRQIIGQIEMGVERALEKTINNLGQTLTQGLASTGPRFLAPLEGVKKQMKHSEFARINDARSEKLAH